MQFESHGSVVQLDGVESVASEVEARMRRGIPGAKQVTGKKADYTVEVELGEPELVVGEERALLGITSEEYITSDVMALASRVFERLYVENDCISMHSATVEIDGSAVLLIGPGTAGKTTTAFKMCEKYDAGYMSGDRTLIDAERAIAGEQTVVCKKGSLCLEFDAFDVELPSGTIDEEGLWQEGIECTHAELGLSRVDDELDIEAIYSVMRLPLDDRLRVVDFSHIEALWDVSKQAVYYSHYYQPLLYGARSVTPVVEGRTQQSKRVSLIADLVETVDCYGITGAMDEMAEFIYRHHFE
ncbi:hypothetical protein NGM10_17585 (plasmid) [Halorussus salilacus]|uniref:hypothetical protein n=1 Tax=Halorussus salilacus TaxID=2953750 RepID=UPI0020A0B62E|nr:hypothetical protein [Halorussus salilacus]USZ70013.1 hypothetical protein NGM10_17585 [Halorussus salilacus]